MTKHYLPTPQSHATITVILTSPWIIYLPSRNKALFGFKMKIEKQQGIIVNRNLNNNLNDQSWAGCQLLPQPSNVERFSLMPIREMLVERLGERERERERGGG